jgi:tetratricopeptide (TPR) repeat protein
MGYGTPVDPNEEFKCNQKALKINPNSVSSLYNLASHYQMARGTEQNIPKAIEYYTRVASEDPKSAKAWNNLAAIYLNGPLQFCDVAQAYKCFRTAARLDPSVDQFWKNLEHCYKKGLGVAKNEALANACASNRELLRTGKLPVPIIIIDPPAQAFGTTITISDLMNPIQENNSASLMNAWPSARRNAPPSTTVFTTDEPKQKPEPEQAKERKPLSVSVFFKF